MKQKVTVTYEIEADQKEWLETRAQNYHMANAGKALRVLLDYAMQEGDEQLIFEKIRCTHC